MGDPYLIHDSAWSTTLSILDVFNLREEERAEAFPLVYERVKRGIEDYAIAKKRERSRLYPRRTNGTGNGEGHP